MTDKTQRQRVAIKRVGSRGSRAETLKNSPVVVRDLLEPPQRRGPAARGFFEMPRIPPRQGRGSNR